MGMKKGVFFSADALIALVLIFLVIIVAYPLIKSEKTQSDVNSDILVALSTLKVRDVDSVYVNSLILEGKVKDVNKTLLEQIGEFYVTNITEARLLAADVLSDLNTTENIGIWYGNELIFSTNKSAYENANEVDVARQLISGLRAEESVTGFSARAFLSSDLRSKYVYFGGYVGDGNISFLVDYSGNISSAEIEIVINEDFELFVNNVSEGNYGKSPSEFEPVRYNISTDNFESGGNIVKFEGENLFVAGGFVKVTYDSEVEFNGGNGRYYFPGIEGLINLYDGFYIPNQLTELEIYLHLDNNYTNTFLNIGNTTVYNGTTNGEAMVTLPDSYLSMVLDYDDLDRETVPLRLGLENASYEGIVLDIDVFSVTDLSGSMCGSCVGGGFWCCLFGGGCNYDQPTCESCGGSCASTAIDSAKDANKLFIDIILNNSENRVGLVGYASDAPDRYYHVLSNDDVSLKSEVDTWEAVGSTCVCCGINRASNSLVSGSSEDKFRSIVVMSDGEANEVCAEQGTGSATQDAIQAACDAYNNHGIVVHAIGFGTNVDEQTLQAIAACGNGYYYYSEVDDLEEVYEQVASSIITDYSEQTLLATGEIYTELFSDSYIDFTYSGEEQVYGLVLTVERMFNNSDYGSFSIPSDADFLSAEAVSYSGPRWTSLVSVNGVDIYDLGEYDLNYIYLGDPYKVTIPESYVAADNIVNVSTGLTPANQTSGSEFNKIIYKIVKNVTAYSPIVGSAEGCVWHIELEGGETIDVPVPEGYSGTDCYFDSTGSVYNENDAFQVAVHNLLEELDLDGDGRIDVEFSEQDLKISLNEVTGIPFTWSTEVQVRRWI